MTETATETPNIMDMVQKMLSDGSALKMIEDISNNNGNGLAGLMGSLSDNIKDDAKDGTKNIMNSFHEGLAGHLEESTSIITKQLQDDEDEDGDEDYDTHYNLSVKLEDLYNGKKKNMSFKRKTFTAVKGENGQESFNQFVEKCKFVIDIPPGTKDGHKIYFRKMGDHFPGHDPCDVIITICEKEHSEYERFECNLTTVRDISIYELFGVEYSFKHMDGRDVVVKSAPGDLLHISEGVRRVVGEGMPIVGDEESKKGDLYIRFNLRLDVIDPKLLTPEVLETIKSIAPPINKNEVPAVTPIELEVVHEDEGDSEDDDSEDDDELCSEDED